MNTVKGGASTTLFEHSRPNNVKRSKFDLSRITNFTMDAGMIVPFDFFEVLPGTTVNLSNSYALDTLPLIQSPITRYKVIVHWYYMKARDMWKGAKTQATRGRSGNISLKTPVVDLDFPFKKNSVVIDGRLSKDYFISHHSLSSFLGVPPKYSGNLAKDSNSVIVDYFAHSLVPDNPSGADANVTGFKGYRYPNALPFMMYQSIVKNNYVNSNLLQDNHALFPVEGDDDWLLPYDATVTNFVGYAKNPAEYDDLVSDVYGVYSSSDKAVRLDQLRYSMFDDDYFTTALPWLQRGDVKTLSAGGDLPLDSIDSIIENIKFDASDAVGDWNNSDLHTNLILDHQHNKFTVNSSSSNKYHLIGAFERLKTRLNEDFKKSVPVNLSVTANQLRELISLSVWQERNARVDGSYNSLIYQHWSVNPRSEEHKPVYMGGFVDYINFSTILQSSESTSSSPLGSTAGRGTSGGSSKINDNFFCEDYGYCMGIIQIKPDTTYMQGVEHALSCKNTFEDIAFPEFENLSPEPILNKEIYVSGEDSVDNDLFGYQEPYMYYKVRQNVNRGLFQQKPDKDFLFGSFTQARWFNSLPKLSYQFLCMSPNNIRRDFLAFPKYPMFRLQFLTSCYTVAGLSYRSEPNTFGF